MIPFIDLHAQQKRIRLQIDAAIAKVLDHGNYIMGPEVAELETALCEFVGAKHCISVSNGTDALVASYMALGVGPGDAVITTPFTFFATVEAIMIVGATPVFADIDPATFNICPNEIEKAVNRVRSENKLNLKGICPVDLFGLCADYQAINQIAEKHGLFVLQDSAQAFAAISDGRRAPSQGTIGIASFFPAKPLGCYGDGGAVFTDDDSLADLILSIRVHGKGVDKYDNVRVGQNCRLNTIQAAILLEKLKIYPDEFEQRQRVAGEFQACVSSIQERFTANDISCQQIPANCRSAWAQFVILSPQRDKIAEELKSAGIPSFVYYRTAAHKLRACRDLPVTSDLSVSERVSGEILALPFHPYLATRTIHQVCDTIENTIQNGAKHTISA